MGFSSTFHIFVSVLCDNLLLTVVVPILPELLRNAGNDLEIKGYYGQHFPTASYKSSNGSEHSHPHHLPNSTLSTVVGGAAVAANYNSDNSHDHQNERSGELARDCLRRLFHLHMLHENSQLGLLFSTKALVQLFVNPLVGSLTFKVGYKIPLCIGNFILLLCSLVFAFANSYSLFVVGRSFHGLASSLISVSGMALVAEAHPVDEERTRFLGRVMGAAALGVLIGYPFGGITFSLFGKLVPFMAIAVVAAANVVFQITKIHKYDVIKAFHPPAEEHTRLLDDQQEKVITTPTTLWSLFKDKSIKIISIAVWLSTTAMAVLEPTLPVWLMENMNPPKWQLGLVFVPDSLGYFVGTNFFGEISLQFGRWKMSMASLAAIGISCFIIPMARKVWQLTLPHFILGLGLGIVDASLMPLLARLADDKYHAGYGAVYALAQTSVALAYSLGPLMGGELVPQIGFPDLIRTIGFFNLLFCPFLFLLSHTDYTRIDGVDADGLGIMDSFPPTTSSSDTDEENGKRRRNFNRFNSNPATTSNTLLQTCSPAPKPKYKWNGESKSSSNVSGINNKDAVYNKGKFVPIFGELLPLKKFDTSYVQSSTYSSCSYQRFHDQLDSD